MKLGNSNTTLVKVKYWLLCGKYVSDNIQIQLLLKLNQPSNE